MTSSKYSDCIFLTSIIILFFSILSIIITFFGIIICLIYWWSLIRFDFPFIENNNPEALSLYKNIIYSIFLSILTILIVIYCLYEIIVSDGTFLIFFISLIIIFPIITFYLIILVLIKSKNSNCEIIHLKDTKFGKNTSNYINWFKNYENLNKIEFQKMRCEKRHEVLNSFFIIFFISIFLILIFGKISHDQFLLGK